MIGTSIKERARHVSGEMFCFDKYVHNSFPSNCVTTSFAFQRLIMKNNARLKLSHLMQNSSQEKSLFEFKGLPFGFCNASATFRRLLETTLLG